MQRILFGCFPTYRASPLKPAWDRVLQVGDASGIQSPLRCACLAAVELWQLGRGCWTGHLWALHKPSHSPCPLLHTPRSQLRRLRRAHPPPGPPVGRGGGGAGGRHARRPQPGPPQRLQPRAQRRLDAAGGTPGASLLLGAARGVRGGWCAHVCEQTPPGSVPSTPPPSLARAQRAMSIPAGQERYGRDFINRLLAANFKVGGLLHSSAATAGSLTSLPAGPVSLRAGGPLTSLHLAPLPSFAPAGDGGAGRAHAQALFAGRDPAQAAGADAGQAGTPCRVLLGLRPAWATAAVCAQLTALPPLSTPTTAPLLPCCRC